MYQISGTVEGVAPILFSRWTEGSTENIRTGVTGGRFSDDERTREALEKVYVDERGLYVPAWNFKKCLIQGCEKAGEKVGRSGAASFLMATVFPAGNVYFDRADRAPDFIHETPGRRPPRTGGACLIKRPALNTGWRLAFRLNVADDRRDAEQIRRSLETAGLYVGLGSWRPEYGRFAVTEWHVTRAES